MQDSNERCLWIRGLLEDEFVKVQRSSRKDILSDKSDSENKWILLTIVGIPGPARITFNNLPTGPGTSGICAASGNLLGLVRKEMTVKCQCRVTSVSVCHSSGARGIGGWTLTFWVQEKERAFRCDEKEFVPFQSALLCQLGIGIGSPVHQVHPRQMK